VIPSLVDDAIVYITADPLLVAGLLVGCPLFAVLGWVVGPRRGWPSAPAAAAGAGLALALAVTLCRLPPQPYGPNVTPVVEPFCHLNGFSLRGGYELLNALMLVPFAFCATLATRNPLAVMLVSITLSGLIELVQGVTGAGICETQDFLNNSAGAIVAAIAAWAVTALHRRPAEV
jgi:hypothetical protein